MRVLEASPISWDDVRQLVGLHIAEIAMPSEVEALYASTGEQGQSANCGEQNRPENSRCPPNDH